MHLRRSIIALTLTFFVLLGHAPLAVAQTAQKPTLEEAVVIDRSVQTIKGERNQIIRVTITKGPHKGETITAVNPLTRVSRANLYKKGDRVVVSYEKRGGKETVLVVDYVRRGGLLVLFFVFLAFVFVIGKLRGAASLAGLLFSFLIISRLLVPQILLGNSPVLMSLLSALLIIPASFLLAHGFGRKTLVSILGTALSLILTAVLAYLAIVMTHLLGFAQEEVLYLQGAQFQNLDIRGLLLAGIIIGAVGILDDITISQASVVERLKAANPRYGRRELYKEAMHVGRDHIASLINTLVLVYTGASLPLLLLFYTADVTFATVVNQEVIATEIVRTLVSSIGIIAAVPITTWLGAYFVSKK